MQPRHLGLDVVAFDVEVYAPLVLGTLDHHQSPPRGRRSGNR